MNDEEKWQKRFAISMLVRLGDLKLDYLPPDEEG